MPMSGQKQEDAGFLASASQDIFGALLIDSRTLALLSEALQKEFLDPNSEVAQHPELTIEYRHSKPEKVLVEGIDQGCRNTRVDPIEAITISASSKVGHGVIRMPRMGLSSGAAVRTYCESHSTEQCSRFTAHVQQILDADKQWFSFLNSFAAKVLGSIARSIPVVGALLFVLGIVAFVGWQFSEMMGGAPENSFVSRQKNTDVVRPPSNLRAEKPVPSNDLSSFSDSSAGVHATGSSRILWITLLRVIVPFGIGIVLARYLRWIFPLVEFSIGDEVGRIKRKGEVRTITISAIVFTIFGPYILSKFVELYVIYEKP